MAKKKVEEKINEHIRNSYPWLAPKDFYKKLGYTEIGEIYKEEFCPHIKMFKDLK